MRLIKATAPNGKHFYFNSERFIAVVESPGVGVFIFTRLTLDGMDEILEIKETADEVYEMLK